MIDIVNTEWCIKNQMMKEDREIMFLMAEKLEMEIYRYTRSHNDIEAFSYIANVSIYSNSKRTMILFGLGTMPSRFELISYSEAVTLMRKEILKREENGKERA